MKNLLLIFSLMFVFYSHASKAETNKDIEAKSCAEECLNLSSRTNANNAGRQNSNFYDKNLAEALTGKANSRSNLQNTIK
ncbi:MAG: hypothetical protein HAW63_00145 [Bdellovibrionaceae bacterium]|nr:hypothetical protein [Pseudobdellovibrionaceae bacterium]